MAAMLSGLAMMLLLASFAAADKGDPPRPPIPDWRTLPSMPPWDDSKWQGAPRIHPDSPNWPNSIAICSIMNNEHPDDVIEFISYHQYAGVSKFYLREHGAAVPQALQQALKPWVDAGVVDLGYLELTDDYIVSAARQSDAFMHMQANFYTRCSQLDQAGAYSWIAFIDLDEYIVPLRRGLAAAQPNLRDMLWRLRGNAGVALQWIMFGSNGHVKRPPGGPLRHYSKCSGSLGFQLKCLANSYWLAGAFTTVHACVYRIDSKDPDAAPVVLSDGTPLFTPETSDPTNVAETERTHIRTRTHSRFLNKTPAPIRSTHKLALFHYATRSLEDYSHKAVKMARSRYSRAFAAAVEEHGRDAAELEAKLEELEAVNHFDGDYPICRSAVRAGYADLNQLPRQVQ